MGGDRGRIEAMSSEIPCQFRTRTHSSLTVALSHDELHDDRSGWMDSEYDVVRRENNICPAMGAPRSVCLRVCHPLLPIRN